MKRVICFLLVAILVFSVALSFIEFPTAKADVTETRTFTTSTSDGNLFSYSSNYDTAHDSATGNIGGGSSMSVGQDYDSGYYYLYRSMVFLDTSIIPDIANITSAVLSLYVSSDGSTADFNVTIQSGQPTYPHNPLASGDYYYSRYSGDGGSANTSTIPGAGYWNITLNDDGLDMIQVAGTTKLALLSSEDIADSAPTGNEYVMFYTREQGVDYAAKLYVTYTVDTEDLYVYNVYGPYLDTPTGDIYNGTVTVTIYPNYNETTSFTLDGTGGTADSEELLTFEQQPIYMTWNISTSGNYTRTYFFTDDQTEDIHVFVPSSDVPYYLYTFNVFDLYGMTNAYLETQLYYNGSNQAVERQKLDAVNPTPFYLQWAVRYNLRVVADQGTVDMGSFTPLSETSQNLVVSRDAFPISYYGFNATVSALRMNATHIQMNYTDSAELTIWVHTEITHRSGQQTITDTTDNTTDTTVQVNWYSADASTDYLVTVTVYRDDETKTFSFSCPHTEEDQNPFAPLNDLGDNFPVKGEYLVGFGIVLAVAAVFSYAHIVAGAFATAGMAAFLTYIHWLDISWILISVGFAVAIMIAIAHFKEREREI